MSGSTIQSWANAKKGEGACRRCNGWGHPPGDKNIPCYSCGATGIEPSQRADAMSDETKMNLFQQGNFTLASGQQASWKIDCDALADKDWECVAGLIARRYNFSEVHGVPTGGNKLAELLQRDVVSHPVSQDFNSLIVDDVYTTGGSIRAMRDQLILRPNGGGKRYMGCVLFARARINPADGWVRPLFQYEN